MIPGSPAATILGPQASAADIAEMENTRSSVQPYWKQFMDYILDVLQGNFGDSYMYNRPVLDLIAERIPNTLQITVTALIIALIIGVGIGMFSRCISIPSWTMCSWCWPSSACPCLFSGWV